MDLPTVPLVTEGTEAEVPEVLLSGWLEKLDGCVGHGETWWDIPSENQGEIKGKSWRTGEIMGPWGCDQWENQKKLGTMDHETHGDLTKDLLEICWKSSCHEYGYH